MRIGTSIKGTLITDSRFTKDVKKAIENYRNMLLCAIDGKGIHLYDFGEEREVKWADGDLQIRQEFELTLNKSLSKNEIYKIINSVQAQPLTIK